MSKRKLTKQQQWRVDKIQGDRTARAQKRSERDEDLLHSGQLGPEQTGLVISRFGAQADVEALEGPLQGQVQRCYIRTHLEGLVTGDHVIWCPGDPTGVVVAQQERRSVLLRPDNYHHLKPVAANIDHIIIVLAPEPEPFHNLIDRYLVAAHASGIEPILLLNKADLITDYDGFMAKHQLQVYDQIGYRVFVASTTRQDGLDNLKQFLRNKTSVFVGQSGVGKSSLVNILLPEAHLAVGALSDIGKGSHTTSAARLFHLPEGGQLIDSPGIREFGLWHIEAINLLEHFVEFRPFLGRCKFRDCSHQHEPQCIIQEALANDHLSQQRFDSYQQIKHMLDDKEKEKYD